MRTHMKVYSMHLYKVERLFLSYFKVIGASFPQAMSEAVYEADYVSIFVRYSDCVWGKPRR